MVLPYYLTRQFLQFERRVVFNLFQRPTILTGPGGTRASRTCVGTVVAGLMSVFQCPVELNLMLMLDKQELSENRFGCQWLFWFVNAPSRYLLPAGGVDERELLSELNAQASLLTALQSSLQPEESTLADPHKPRHPIW